MIKKIIAIVAIVALFWALQWAGIISPFLINVSGFILIIFGFLFTVMIGDTIESLGVGSAVTVGFMFIIIGVILILIQPASLL